jgi:ankyrin repeat protein
MKSIQIHESFHYTKYNHAAHSKFYYFESVTYLLSSIHNQHGRSALLLASKNGHLEVVQCLLERDVSIYDKDKVRYISFIPSLFFY